MLGRQSVIIFIDQSPTISKLIQTVIPNTTHGLYLWHIFQNTDTNLSSVIHSFRKFVKDFKHCIYGYCTVEIIEKIWDDLLNK